jgi:hypothetical protein
MSAMRFWWIAVMATACASGGSGEAESAAAPAPGAGHAYVYQSGEAIYRQDTRTGTDEPVVRNVGAVLAAAASSSGRQLAVAFRSGGTTQIVAIDNETGSITDVHEGPTGTVYTLAWSSGGDLLGVGFQHTGGGGVKLLDASGTVRDIGCEASDRFVAFRSASEAIVSDGTNFYTVSSEDCGTLATVARLGRSELEFAPNGRRVAYFRERTVTFTNRPQPEIVKELWVAQHDGRGERLIADYQSRPQNAEWSANANLITYEVVSRRWTNTLHVVMYDVSGNTYIYVAEEKELGVPSDFNVCWSPDNYRIAHERTYARVGQAQTYTTRHVVVRGRLGAPPRPRRQSVNEKVVFEELIGEEPGGMPADDGFAPCRWIGPHHLLISTRQGQRVIGVDDGTVHEFPADQRVLAAAAFGGAR